MNLQSSLSINDVLKMARIKDKQRALDLRKEGKSYSQIRSAIGVSKSTLSYWLRDFPLPEARIRELRDWNQQRIEHYRQTRLKTRTNRLNKIYLEQKKIIFPLSKRDILIAGLFLYWGEGSKTRISELEIANTDPAVPKFFIYWVTKFLKLDRQKIKIHLHLYSDMSTKKETEFWSSALEIPKNQFRKPYIKENSSKFINRGTFGHGTCTIKVSNARVSEEVMMGLKTIRDRFGP
ncbi:helix-turn-helix domain-containing protein [bacterium]|nr:MAG: helix-turn-helix domain-containing protein [bacterium]